ncbi:MAG: hypothetical protein COS85_13235 [Armatimonadetes bacterium CG07_land_8_20_14_0_80_59_28]|nr:MAG: hypothetical protein COS85_13235 [Armatimonadetes bacterium CG07_land_8_20_14_0_80_59_28]PIY49025.1 MAG: hypothetical protein COZ05_01570 [Armatimonadetes bacterium CG_4_10_14_3_um_filter_59_10]
MAVRTETILVVDDQPSVVQLCKRLLESQGFSAVGASSGEEALEKFRQQRFDLLLVDLVLPGIDGVETFRQAKEMQNDLVGIVITGHATKGSVVDAMKSGLYGFIEKPFTMRELMSTIDDVLQRNSVEKENVRLRAFVPLFEVTKAMTSTRQLEDLYRLVLDTALQEAGAERGSLMHLDERSSELRIVAARGLPTEILEKTRQKVGDGIAGLVAESREPLILNDGQMQDERIAQLMRPGSNLSAICYPLLSEGRMVGVLNLSRSSAIRTFSESDKELLSILSGQAASAIVSAQLNENLSRSYVSTIEVLAKAIMARDPYTRDHSDNVSLYAVRVAEELGLSGAEIETVRFASILHDIGKIGISEGILLKPGKLTDEEFEKMKEHPAIGANILADAEFPWDIVPIVYHHQEKYDGTGYPDGLTGEAIPIGARIISVCDTYQAVTSDRAYRKALPEEKAIDILRKVSGTQLDGNIVALFLKIHREVDGKGTVAQQAIAA